MWDSDTRALERTDVADVAEILVGKFPRHSEDFYAWRVEDRRERLAEDPDDLRAMDDLAVALDRLGHHAEAIEVMERALGIDPDRYETLANLSTMHIHAGELQTGLRYIESALQVNPDPHFGRERAQALLVQYVLERGPQQRPLDDDDRTQHQLDRPKVEGFAAFVRARGGGEDDEQAIADALRGVLGMMRFSDHRSPVLLEAAGDLMLALPQTTAPRHLAAWAYARAAAVTDSPTARQAYRELAEDALFLVDDGTNLAQVEYDLNWEVSNADAWFATLCDRERAWIADPDVDPQAAFEAAYLAEPITLEDPDDAPHRSGEDWRWLFVIPAVGAVLIVVAGRSAAMS